VQNSFRIELSLIETKTTIQGWSLTGCFELDLDRSGRLNFEQKACFPGLRVSRQR